MSKVNVVRRCYNCGAVLQSTDPKKEGFLENRFLKNSSLNQILFCEKCYKEGHFNLKPQEASVSKEFLTMLLDAKATGALIVYVIDLFSFECSFIPEISGIIQSLPILVLANKRDLMPSSAKNDDLREYVAHRFRVAQLPVQKEDVSLVSLTSLTDLRDIAVKIEEKRCRHDVYIIGAKGSGKSYFLASFIRGYSNNSPRAIMTTDYPGTALRVMQIPLDSSSMIYDTPGTGIANSLLGKGDAELDRVLFPNAPLSPRRFILEKGQSLFLGCLARIDLLKAPKKKTEVLLYAAPGVEIKKITAKKDMDEEFKKALAKETCIPTSRLVSSLRDLDVFDFPVEETGSRDIGIAGLGWMNFVGENQLFRLFVPKGCGVYGSRAKVK